MWRMRSWKSAGNTYDALKFLGDMSNFPIPIVWNHVRFTNHVWSSVATMSQELYTWIVYLFCRTEGCRNQIVSIVTLHAY